MNRRDFLNVVAVGGLAGLSVEVRFADETPTDGVAITEGYLPVSDEEIRQAIKQMIGNMSEEELHALLRKPNVEQIRYFEEPLMRQFRPAADQL